MPEISVAMATYNGATFVDAQLETLAAQTRRPTELVVVDDGSSDSTLDRVEAFAAYAPFAVSIFRNEHRLGWRGNFVKAAGLCRGELIAFCDQDDLWYPSKLEVMAGLFASPRTLLAYHDADLVDVKGSPIGRLRAHESDQALLPPRKRPTTWSNPLGLTLVFRRVLTAFQRYWPLSVDPRDPQTHAAHDQWYYYLAANLGFVAYAPQPLLAYRQHGGNAVGYQIGQPRRTSLWRRRTPPPSTDYMATLSAFCRVLRAAEADGLTDLLPELPAALRANERYFGCLRTHDLAQHDRGRLRRMRHFLALLRARAYSRRTDWNLGYRALLDAALIGVPFGR